MNTPAEPLPTRNLRLVSRLRSTYDQNGTARSRILGQGLEFAELRPYAFGDDVKRIDWRSTARSGQVQVKTYTEERALGVVLAIDVSASTFAGSVPSRQRIMAFASLIAKLTQRDQHALGLLTFGAIPDPLMPPRRGPRVSQSIIRSLDSQSLRSGTTAINTALSYLVQQLRRRSLIFLVSDFLAPAFETELLEASLRHDIILTLAEAQTMPRKINFYGLLRVRDAETGETRLIRPSAVDTLRADEASLRTLATRCQASMINISQSISGELSALMARRIQQGAQ